MFGLEDDLLAQIENLKNENALLKLEIETLINRAKDAANIINGVLASGFLPLENSWRKKAVSWLNPQRKNSIARKKVSKEEFENFIKIYPKSLEYDFCAMYEPPIGTYNDFSTGKVWPDSVVASICLNESMKGHPVYKGELNEYYVHITNEN